MMTFKEIEKVYHAELLTLCAKPEALARETFLEFTIDFCQRHDHSDIVLTQIKEGFLWSDEEGKFYKNLENPVELIKEEFLKLRRIKIKG